MKFLKVVSEDKNISTVMYYLENIVSITFPEVVFDGSKTKAPAIYIKFEDGSTATFSAKNWFLMYS